MVDNYKKIYLIGNPLIEIDSMPFKIKPILEKELPKIQFLEFDPTENFPEESCPIFIDTAINLKKVRMFNSVDNFTLVASNNLSVHNFDFYIELMLRKKAGFYEDYFIIAVPPRGTLKAITQDIKIAIKKCTF